jgi:phosphoribosylformylglycinamidine cyclo-ligase
MSKRKAYEDAGVNIDAAGAFAEEIRHHLKRTWDPRVMDNPRGFAGLFRLDHAQRLFARNYRDPVLVACANGVGTKLKVAFLMQKHDTVGIDLVAMNVNDVVAEGGEPLFFLDYLATSRLKSETMCEVVAGVANGCLEAECALLRGETAEMPGFYAEGEYDLAGFAVGVVERGRIFSLQGAEVGDRIIGLASSGLHANGYALARKVFFEKAGLSVNDYVEELGGTLGRELLRPTRIYVKSVLKVLRCYRVKQVIHGIAHITGGGLAANIPRILGDARAARIRKGSWPVPPVFPLLKKLGDVDDDEMFGVFNMGLGMVLVVSPYYADAVMKRFRRQGIEPYHIGEVTRGKQRIVIE